MEMGFWDALFGRSKKREKDVSDPADNFFSDEDDYVFRERVYNRDPAFRQREEDRDTVDEIKRERGDDNEDADS